MQGLNDFERLVLDKLIAGDHPALASLRRQGAGFVLFIRSGRLSVLEGFTYGEDWPDVPPILSSVWV